ncbi:MAG: hypothetical protein J1F60_03060 [Oscillospiraceae bacterium]|nr:hypothetical protein [Oscillospiraceae bacterium]
MLTTEPTEETVREWKSIHAEYREKLKPNRKTGVQVKEYFTKKYSPEQYDSAEFASVVEYNIVMNEHEREKLPEDELPQIATYKLGDGQVLVGIDLVTGFIHVECEDTVKAAEIYDDLFLFRGLDEKDIDNFFLTAQYIQCLDQKKKGR